MGGSGSTQLCQKTVAMVKNEIASNKIQMFSKTYCPYCKMAKDVLNEICVPYNVMEIENRDDGPEIQKVLKDITGSSSVPQVFINGQSIGGGTETKKLHENGKLLELINSQ
uniref:monothiol glutaredoxin-S6-like n=1 Tax=Ciona intestinalis TaxID=7719 RepID=UPI0002B8ED00|nr:monothiol glutaredoxin-S6-like [Ciona intestinalis]|eukprot:XP_004226857.1 monothiol glutaredoxin-S6-like [Ciona intestinalis]